MPGQTKAIVVRDAGTLQPVLLSPLSPKLVVNVELPTADCRRIFARAFEDIASVFQQRLTWLHYVGVLWGFIHAGLGNHWLRRPDERWQCKLESRRRCSWLAVVACPSKSAEHPNSCFLHLPAVVDCAALRSFHPRTCQVRPRHCGPFDELLRRPLAQPREVLSVAPTYNM